MHLLCATRIPTLGGGVSCFYYTGLKKCPPLMFWFVIDGYQAVEFAESRGATRTCMPNTSSAFREEIKKRAIIMEIGGFRPPVDPIASWFGKVTLALENEKWPQTVDFRPMAALAQINLTELPFRPSRLDDIDFLTVFVDPQKLGKPSASNWCLRSYPKLSDLTALKAPEKIELKIKALPLRPTIVHEDYPKYEDIAHKIPNEIIDSYIEDFENVPGFKLGGWPTLIQSEIFWAPRNEHPANPEFVFQIDSSEKGCWSWGDGGVGYFGRGTTAGHRDEWFLEWQCY
jgi:uncharacterized protein YwqG